MKRFMTVAWVCQCAVFVSLALAYLGLPVWWHGAFHYLHLDGMLRDPALRPEGVLVVAALRMAAPLALAMALFSAHAAMRDDLDARRLLARTFALPLGAWAASLVEKRHEFFHTPYEGALFWVVAAFAIVNAAHGFAPLHRPYARPLSGMANTRPPQLWVLWLVQGLCFLAAGAVIAFEQRLHLHVTEGAHRAFMSGRGVLGATPDALMRYLTVSKGHTLDAAALIRDEAETFPPYCLAMACFSFYAMRASREWVWRLLCGVFAFTFLGLLVVLTVVVVGEPEMFRVPVVLPVFVPLAAFLVGNGAYARRRVDYFTQDVGEGPDGWTVTDLGAGPLMLLRTLLGGGRRAHHATGVGARGHLTVELGPCQAFPRQEYFEPGARFPVVARFSSLRASDDAAVDARGVALRLKSKTRGPFDLMLSTGAFSSAANMVDFFLGLVLQGLGRRAWRLFAQPDLQRREAAVAGLRRAPESFTKLRYHSQLVRFWVDAWDVRHLVRYRLVPDAHDGAPAEESGLLGPGDDPSDRRRAPDERRAPDYLRRDLKQRLETPPPGRKAPPVCFRLEAQFHAPAPGDAQHWYNPSVDWRADDHPWVHVGRLVLDAALPDEETERLQFDPGNHPPSLGTPSSNDLWDYRSMADSERRVVRRIQELRAWMHAVFGVPEGRSRAED